jgi:hypothetical protein
MTNTSTLINLNNKKTMLRDTEKTLCYLGLSRYAAEERIKLLDSCHSLSPQIH